MEGLFLYGHGVSRLGFEPVAEQVKIDGLAVYLQRSNEFAVVLRNPGRRGVLHELEVFEVAAGGELVMPVVVAVVHQYPDVLVDELEHACTFDRFGRLLQSLARLAPLRTGGLSACGHQGIRGHLADSAVALVLVEGVVLAVDGVVDDVHVDGRLAAVKEMRRFAFQIGKVLRRNKTNTIRRMTRTTPSTKVLGNFADWNHPDSDGCSSGVFR